MSQKLQRDTQNYTLSVVAPVVEDAVAFLRWKRPVHVVPTLVAYLKAQHDATTVEDFDTLPPGLQVDIPKDLFTAIVQDLVKTKPDDILPAIIKYIESR